MRALIRTTRLSSQLCVLGLIVFLTGSSFAQASLQNSDLQQADDIEPDKQAPGSPDQESGNKKKDTTGGISGLKNMRDDTLRRMGPYTPRELYPSLMQLGDLSSEKRAEIKQLARQRTEDSLQIINESRAALSAATEDNDLSRMAQAAAAPTGLAYDGVNTWVGNQGDDTVTKLRGIPERHDHRANRVVRPTCRQSRRPTVRLLAGLVARQRRRPVDDDRR